MGTKNLPPVLERVTLAYLDVETTGLSAQGGDRVCEIAVVRTRGGEVLDRLDTLVCPGRPIPPGASAVNGITDSMVASMPRFPDIALRLISMLEGAVIVAHNARFDMGFLAREFSMIPLLQPRVPVLDTLGIARKHFRFAQNGLEAIAAVYGISTEGNHRALADVLITKGVLERFAIELEGRGMRLESVDDLLALQR